MSSEQFENKEEEFRSVMDGLRNKIQRSISTSRGELRKRVIRELNREVEDASILIHEMEDELKKAPSPYRLQMATQVRNCKRELEEAQKDLNKATVEPGQRLNVNFSPEDDFERMESAQRSRLMQGTDSLNRASESIARSHRIAAETDQIGTDIIDDLGTQRESLLRTRDRLQETQANLSKSRQILNSMARRIMTNKLILVVIIFLEVCILGGLVYWKFFS